MLVDLPMTTGGAPFPHRTPLPKAQWRPATVVEQAMAGMPLSSWGEIVWNELLRLTAPDRQKASTDMLLYGAGAWFLPEVVDGHGPRPAILDDQGRRWLLDGSGEVA